MSEHRRLWKFYCMGDDYPGMWQRWFKNQCVAVGWAGIWGYRLNSKSIGKLDNDHGWNLARPRIREIKKGDHIVVSLSDHRIGRIGEVTGTAVGDEDWEPLVPPSKDNPDGEIGRRIFVRWEMTTGPDDRDLVVKLPEGKRLNPGELRHTVAEVRSLELDDLRRAMNDQRNWVSLFEFPYEKSLSDYIAAYPHRLEDGLLPHPNKKFRERVFKNGKRLDVLLEDRNEKPVIVECKQDGPTVSDVRQLQSYLSEFKNEEETEARGILVHGGARKLRPDVRQAARKRPRVELVQFTVEVNFSTSS
jgi:Endonuclease NucS